MVEIRTVMIAIPSLFRDLILELTEGRATLEVVGDFDTRFGLEEQLQELAPNLILIKLCGNEGDEVGLELVEALPSTKVIAFSSNAREAFVYRMPHQRCVLLGGSPRSLIDAITGS